jgi:molybdopterin-biosynthesis enzyme MoeA-like protein
LSTRRRAKVIYAVPGVPHEMNDMVQRAVLPDLLVRGRGRGRGHRQPHAAHLG